MEIQKPHYIIVSECNSIYHGKDYKGHPLFYSAFFNDVKVYHSKKRAERVMKTIKWNSRLRLVDCNTLN